MQTFPAPSRLGILVVALLFVAACNRPAGGDDVAAAQPDAPSQAGDSPAPAEPSTVPEAGSPAAALLDQYGSEAADLASALAEGAETDRLTSQAEGLVDRAAEIVPAFVGVHPHCAPYLEAALQVRERWPQLDHETMERDYHHDGALPKIENAGFCYHMKDLITHPASVLVLLSQDEPDLVQAKAEIDEVLAHMQVVRDQF
jgi:hypothetical protein